jgi:hypothetical protein
VGQNDDEDTWAHRGQRRVIKRKVVVGRGQKAGLALSHTFFIILCPEYRSDVLERLYNWRPRAIFYNVLVIVYRLTSESRKREK